MRPHQHPVETNVLLWFEDADWNMHLMDEHELHVGIVACIQPGKQRLVHGILHRLHNADAGGGF